MENILIKPNIPSFQYSIIPSVTMWDAVIEILYSPRTGGKDFRDVK